jgi:penicillin-binding protein 1A
MMAKRRKKNNKKSSRRGQVIKVLLTLLLAGFFLFVFFVFLVWVGVFGEIPSREQLAAIRQNTASEVYSADGRLMGRYYLENRLTVGNDRVSPYVKHALVATEDARFFEHHGIDYISLGRVLVKTILLRNRAQGGGSTLSEQLARNLFPRPGKKWTVLLVSKVKEAVIAARLEKVYDKEQILMLYLNTVPFGEDIYGIETASLRFFGKHAGDLNPAEAATLIGMLAANTAYNPRLHPERSRRRRDIVLRRMGEHGFLKKNEVKKWQQTPIRLHYTRIDNNTGIAPYFRDYLKVRVERYLKENYGDTLDLLTDGLKIYTSIHSGIQQAAAQAVKQRMALLQKEFDAHWRGRRPVDEHSPVFLRALQNAPRYRIWKAQGLEDEEIMKKMHDPVKGADGHSYTPLDSLWRSLMTLHAGFVAIDPVTGYVRAWVGGVDHSRWQYDHVTSRRQVGSTFKPFVYAAALEAGMEPCEFISNERRTFPQFDDWSPENAEGEYEGYYSLKGALAHSVNTVTAELINRTGVEQVVSLAHRLGVETEIPEVPSIALGSVSLSLYELTRAYCPFVNGGRRTDPVVLTKIIDKKGRILYEYKPSQGEAAQVLSRDVSLEMLYMLREVVDSGTARSLHSAYRLPNALAGKTGTTQNNADGWFIGILPRLVTGTWVGAESPEIHFRTLTLGQGAHTALPVFALFVQGMNRDATVRKYAAGSFPALYYPLTERMNCADFSPENPEKNFFERLFGRKQVSDSLRQVRKKEKEQRKDARRKRIRDAMRRIFGGNN